jgi:lipopolysaccharide/colanic/teichoic acid biosynthesis glycosyltransferase
MRRLRRLGVALAPIVVVLVLGELHAHLIGHYQFTGTQRFLWTAAYIVLLELSAYVAGMFDDQRSALSATWSALGAALGGGVVISVFQLLLGSLLLPRAVVFGAALLLFGIYLAVGLSARRDLRSGVGSDRVLGVLTPDEAMALEADFTRVLERPARLVGILDPVEVATASGTGPGSPGLLLVDTGARTRATVVVLGREALVDESIVAQAALLHGRGVRVRTLGLFYDGWFGKLPIADLERLSLMFDIQELHAPGYARLKRIVDLGAAAVGLVALVVVAPLVWLLDQVGNRGPLFFRQTRVGKGGEPFSIVKFRTMPPTTEESEWTRESDPRIGVLGRWMRRFHIDELPQSVNILRGELSLVGPRPEQPRYVDELREKIPFYDVRHLVLPGVTGWAQVKFPYGASVEDALEKLQYEFFYLRHQGPMLDVRILARTVRTVLRAGGR